MTSRPSDAQGPQSGLFDDEPKPNSPEDLGAAPVGPPDPERPRARRPYGRPRPDPNPIPVNVASGTIQITDARKFVAWLSDQEFPIHRSISVGTVVVNLSGFTPKDLGWLCRACRQAQVAPAPELMRSALLKRDVSLLRGSAGEEDEEEEGVAPGN